MVNGCFVLSLKIKTQSKVFVAYVTRSKFIISTSSRYKIKNGVSLTHTKQLLVIEIGDDSL